MKVGDIVELIDENEYGSLYRGRMTVVGIKDHPDEYGELIVECKHLDYKETCLFLIEELVIMDEM